jgi:hypothetical protein
LSQAYIDPSSPPGSGWSGNPIVFRSDIHEEYEVMDFHIDYFTLTGDEIISAGDVFTIFYELTAETSVDLSFYYDTDQDLTNGGRVAMTEHTYLPNLLLFPIMSKNISSVSFPAPEIDLLTGDTWHWDTQGVPPGTYYVSIDANDGVNTTTWYSEVPVIIE